VTTFLIICAVMVVAALVLVLVPLLREDKPRTKGEQPSARSVPAAVALMVDNIELGMETLSSKGFRMVTEADLAHVE
jgi:energy-converting hydrogenase Eha subunit A